MRPKFRIPVVRSGWRPIFWCLFHNIDIILYFFEFQVIVVQAILELFLIGGNLFPKNLKKGPTCRIRALLFIALEPISVFIQGLDLSESVHYFCSLGDVMGKIEYRFSSLIVLVPDDIQVL